MSLVDPVVRAEASLWGVLAGSAVGSLLGVGGAKLLATGNGDYGWAMFVGLPILQGMAAALVAQIGGPYPWGWSGWTATFSLLLSAVGVMVFAMEGIVCLIMATPLILPLVLLGAWLGWVWTGGERAPSVRLHLPMVAALSVAVGGGAISPAPESTGEVTTVWHVDAPPVRVWPYVLNLDSLPRPEWWLFRMGVAYPLRTKTHPDGSRECLLSTGPMPEIVTAREPERRLAFRVLKTPPSMNETNPFGEVRAAHLATTYVGREGEFILSAEGAGTRIVARSGYGLRMAPFWYWRLWSDAIVRHVQERVVREIGKRAVSRWRARPRTQGASGGKALS